MYLAVDFQTIKETQSLTSYDLKEVELVSGDGLKSQGAT